MSIVPDISTTELPFPQIRLVLVVEHHPDFGPFLVQAIRQKTHYKAILARSGQDALTILQYFKCDLFLLDFHLPDIDIFDLYDQLHVSKEYRDIPVLFLNTKCHDPQRSKSNDVEKLLQAMLNLLGPAGG